jgi:hypothetical protein
MAPAVYAKEPRERVSEPREPSPDIMYHCNSRRPTNAYIYVYKGIQRGIDIQADMSPPFLAMGGGAWPATSSLFSSRSRDGGRSDVSTGCSANGRHD